jgi:hypothetical protein
MKRSRSFFVCGVDRDGCVDPEKVLEECATIDFARIRAAKLSSKQDSPIVVWCWNEENGYRRCRAWAKGGLVWWTRPCLACKEAGCERCGELGALRDENRSGERAG